MKLIIPLKKPAPVPVKAQIAAPEHVPHTECKHEPQECKFCQHVYGNPCHGKPGCPNYDFRVNGA
ncbi:hypothetical protein EVB27_106 [Rhizobium phage RHph_TM16]|nr:hypothetical protein EVB27_106 [Rhizobium phage RHph_TM16]